MMAQRIAQDPRRGGDLESRLDAALRVGLAILTEGILVAPLEGLAEVHVVRGRGGASYVELSYAGPIRAAGGTAQALSVLLADIVRRDLGLGAFTPDDAEIGRYQEEIPCTSTSSISNTPRRRGKSRSLSATCPCASPAKRPRATRRSARFATFRGCLRTASAEEPAWCSPKDFAKNRRNYARSSRSWGCRGGSFSPSSGTPTPIARPIPDRRSIFERRWEGAPSSPIQGGPEGSASPTAAPVPSGLASLSINPATMVILRRFIAVGTQVKVEFPGKASAMSLCDTVEGPIVELNDGTVTAVHDRDRAEGLVPQVRRIVDLGEILVPFGEFLENNRALSPGAYTLDWYLAELEEAGAGALAEAVCPTYSGAVEISRVHGVPLHPRHLLFWHDATTVEIARLSEFVEHEGRWDEGRLKLPWDAPERELLTRLGFLHAPTPVGKLAGNPDGSAALLGGLGLSVEQGRIVRRTELDAIGTDPLALVSRLASVTVKARGPTRVGARVGRPEKARQRSMSPNVHALFPVGESGGARRSIPEAARRTGRLDPDRTARRPDLPGVRAIDGLDEVPVREPHPADRGDLLRRAADSVPLARGDPQAPPPPRSRGQGSKGPDLAGKGPRDAREGDPSGLPRRLGLPGRDEPVRPHRPAAHPLPALGGRPHGPARPLPRLYRGLVRPARSRIPARSSNSNRRT